MKKQLFSLFIAFIAAMGFSSCEESIVGVEGEFSGYEEADLTKVFTAEAAKVGSFTFAINCAWNAVVEMPTPTKTEWLTIDQTSGKKGVITIEFILAENGTDADRDAKIMITCDTGESICVNVKQKVAIVKDLTNYEESTLAQLAPYEAGVAGIFTFTAAADWTVSSDSDWLILTLVEDEEIVPESSRTGDTGGGTGGGDGSVGGEGEGEGEGEVEVGIEGGVAGDSKFNFKVTQNNEAYKRVAIVTIKCGETEVEITLEQAASTDKSDTFTNYDKKISERVFLYDAQTSSAFTFNAKGNWVATLDSDLDWLSIDNKSGKKGDGSIIFTLAKNDTEAKRTTTVIIESRGEELPITITQEIIDGFSILIFEQFDEDKDGVLSDAEINKIRTIDCKGLGLTSLPGIERFTRLSSLDCSNNKLTELPTNAFKTTSINKLICHGNQIVELDFRGATRGQKGLSKVSTLVAAPMETLITLYVTDFNADTPAYPSYGIKGVYGNVWGVAEKGFIPTVRDPKCIDAKVNIIAEPTVKP